MQQRHGSTWIEMLPGNDHPVQARDAVRFLKAIPALPVRNVNEAAAFYRDRMGFSTDFADPGFGTVSRGGVEIHFWAASDDTWSQRANTPGFVPIMTGAESFLAGTASCRIEVDGIEELYAELKATGVLYGADTVIETTPWGTREFPALDLERNLLTFYEHTRD